MLLQRLKQFFTTKPGIYLGVVLLIASFLRLYNLSNTLQFLGDQGRDSLIVSKIFKEGDLVFIGPVTSVGNMYLGPLYYYFMTPFLFLSYPSPMGPVYAVAFLGILTVGLLYYLGKDLIGPTPALIAATFYTFCSIAIEYTRFSWNPNPAPFVSLIMIWATYKAWQKDQRFWILVSICFSVLIQLHYLTLLSAAGAGLIWLYQAFNIFKKDRKKLSSFAVITAISFVLFLVSLTPLVLFDYKHDGLNAKAFVGLFTEEESFKVAQNKSALMELGLTILEMHGRTLHILFEYSIGKFREINTVLSVATLVALGYILKQKKNPYRAGQIVITSFLVTGIVGTAFYEHTVFDHYIAYLFPVTFLIYGIVLGQWWSQKWGKALAVVSFLIFLALNISRYPLRTISWTIHDIKRTSEAVVDHIKDGEKYNVILMSETKDLYAQNYRYYLNTFEKKTVPPEGYDEATALVIINEQHLAKPTDTPIYEIVLFPNKTPSESYTIPNGPEIIILRK